MIGGGVYGAVLQKPAAAPQHVAAGVLLQYYCIKREHP